MAVFRTIGLQLLGYFWCITAYGQTSRQIAITLDDLPYAHGGTISAAQQAKDFRNILEVLDAYGIKCTGFAIGGSVNEANQHLLDEFVQRGHQLGNHTFSHPDLNSVSALAYCQDIENAGRVLAPWMGKDTYFRFPYLRQGNTPAKRDSVRTFLRQKGYRMAAVTIDNDEWIYNRDFVKANATSSNKKQADRIGEAYLQHMQERTEYFEKLAVEKLNRPVRHILLLHLNAINAQFLTELLAWYRGQGWQFITLSEALQDPLYQIPDSYTGEAGVSVLERINKQ